MEDTLRDRFVNMIMESEWIIPDELKSIETLIKEPLSLSIDQNGIFISNTYFISFHKDLVDLILDMVKSKMFRKYNHEEIITGYEFECDLYGYNVPIYVKIVREYVVKFGSRDVFLHLIHFRNEHDRMSSTYDLINSILFVCFELIV